MYQAIIRIAAISGNSKARFWVEGRKNWQEKLKHALKSQSPKRIWFHCASLGEFEQGRPLIESIKNKFPETCVVLTFFSPSGYEVRKNYPLADVICYLPLDSRRNAKKFIEIVSPTKVFFIKYEYWFYYFDELGKNRIPLYLASAIFRHGQVFFRSYGGFFRKALNNVTHFFVQDENSKKLLDSIGISNSTIAGDTRFDRVASIRASAKPIELLDNFKNKRRLIIAGSTWIEDEEMLLQTMSGLDIRDIAIVIAPHEVSGKRTAEIIQTIHRYHPNAPVATFSSGKCTGKEKFLILDTIGLLSSAYSYGTIAWIGGGFGKGIHNILEAAAFGNPVLFGPNYHKFKEANDLIRLNGAFSVNKNTAGEIISRLLNESAFYSNSSRTASDYVSSNRGATEKILSSTGLLLPPV